MRIGRVESLRSFKSIFSKENYREGYEQLVDDIVKNPTDMSRIKVDLSEITTDYPWILELNHRELFWRLRQKSALAIVCLIMNEECRNYYLLVWTGVEWDTEHNKDKSDMYAAICSMLEDPQIRAELEKRTIDKNIDIDSGRKYNIFSEN